MTGNRILEGRPAFNDDMVIVVAPLWFSALLRFISLLFGLGVAWVGWRHWSEMPIWVRGLVVILSPAFVCMAIDPRGWSSLSTDPFVVAGDDGIFLPSQRPRVLGRPAKERWLFVPWCNVARVREAQVDTSDGRSSCAGMDVRATAEEIEEFFVGRLTGERALEADQVPLAFYVHRPPGPRHVVARIAAQAARCGTSRE